MSYDPQNDELFSLTQYGRNVNGISHNVSVSAFIPCIIQKKAVTADKTTAVTAFSIGQEVSLYIFPMGYWVAILQSFLLRRICIQTD